MLLMHFGGGGGVGGWNADVILEYVHSKNHDTVAVGRASPELASRLPQGDLAIHQALCLGFS